VGECPDWPIKMALAIYRQTFAFPREEMLGLTSQLRRATGSTRRDAFGSKNTGNPAKRDHYGCTVVTPTLVTETQEHTCITKL